MVMMENKSSWIEQAKSLRSQGSLETTLDFLNQILKTHPNDPLVYYHIAWTHDALGKESDAVPAYEKAVSVFPNNGALKTFLAMTLFNLRNHDKAMELLIQELVRSSSDPQVQVYRRALLYYSDKLNDTFE